VRGGHLRAECEVVHAMVLTLVLNASYEPLCLVTLRRAVVLVLAEKAVVVEQAGAVLHSERMTVPAPTVVRLSRFVRVPYHRSVPLSRRAVLERDGHQCAYCDRRADSVDHVIPRARGGRHAWDNVVAACFRCNHRKASHLLAELGWTLPFTPKPPPPTVALLVGVARREPVWDQYLATWKPGPTYGQFALPA